jgi:hypothetical protein
LLSVVETPFETENKIARLIENRSIRKQNRTTV